MKTKLSLLLILVMMLTILTPETTIAATIKINNTSAVVPVGMYKKLSVSGTSKKVSWSSSNKTVAAVSSSGIVTGKKSGTATILAKVSGKALKCKVTVINRYNAEQVGNATVAIVQKYYKRAHLVEYERSGNSIELLIGRPVGDGAPGRTVTVDISTGKATWEYYWDDFFSKMPRNFTVWNCKAVKKVTKITLNRASASVVKGKTLTLKATITPSDAMNKGVTWISSNKKVATVTSKGVVKGLAYGTATITAKARDGSGKTAACKITVTKSSAVVPNVTESFLKKKIADAAKVLGYKQRLQFGLRGHIVAYTKTKIDNPLGRISRYNYIKCESKEENKNGRWGVHITDKTLALFGVKVGMTRAQVQKALTKAKWKYAGKDSSDSEYELNYYPTDKNSIMYKNKGEISVYFDEDTKRVYMMYYYVGND